MKSKSTLSRLMGYAAAYKKRLVLIFFCALVSSGCVLATPFLIGKSVDQIIGANNVNFFILMRLLAVLLGLYLLGSTATWLLTSLSMTVSNQTVKDMRRDGFQKITTLPLKFFDSSKSGDTMSRFSNDIDAISEGLLQAITQLFSSVMTIVGTMVLMILLNFWIALAVVVVAPMAILIAGYIARRSNALFQQQQAIIGEYNGCIEEAIGNLKLVKAYAYEKNIEAAAREINQRLYNCGQKAQFYSSLINPSTRFVNNMAYVSVGLIGGLSAAVGGLSIGAISSLLAYSAQFAKPLNEVAGITTQLQSALAAAKRFFALLDETSEPAENDKLLLKSLDSQNAIGQIEFSKVYFSYDERVPLIENFSIKIPQGSLVAVVGPTGAGKTTLVNLLMRFYDLDSGIISIDKQNTQEVTRDSVRLSFGMVLQETWLFSGSVRDNIAYGRPDATEQEIIDAAKASRAHGFIKRMEKGYDTVITEDGENLSQGEKQLLTIARAMLANPPMLILDEATSSVDPRTELKIQHALQNLMKGKTSFMIAHRLSTIQNADIILVMNQGKIVETGTHRQLINAGGLYSKLYHSQFSKT